MNEFVAENEIHVCVVGWDHCTGVEDVEYTVDPCAFELHGDEDKHWICGNCVQDLAWEI